MDRVVSTARLAASAADLKTAGLAPRGLGRSTVVETDATVVITLDSDSDVDADPDAGADSEAEAGSEASSDSETASACSAGRDGENVVFARGLGADAPSRDDGVADIVDARHASQQRLRSAFEAIYAKYERQASGGLAESVPDEDVVDEIDLRTLEIVVDRGWIQRLKETEDLVSRMLGSGVEPDSEEKASSDDGDHEKDGAHPPRQSSSRPRHSAQTKQKHAASDLFRHMELTLDDGEDDFDAFGGLPLHRRYAQVAAAAAEVDVSTSVSPSVTETTRPPTGNVPSPSAASLQVASVTSSPESTCLVRAVPSSLSKVGAVVSVPVDAVVPATKVKPILPEGFSDWSVSSYDSDSHDSEASADINRDITDGVSAWSASPQGTMNDVENEHGDPSFIDDVPATSTALHASLSSESPSPSRSNNEAPLRVMSPLELVSPNRPPPSALSVDPDLLPPTLLPPSCDATTPRKTDPSGRSQPGLASRQSTTSSVASRRTTLVFTEPRRVRFQSSRQRRMPAQRDDSVSLTCETGLTPMSTTTTAPWLDGRSDHLASYDEMDVKPCNKTRTSYSAYRGISNPGVRFRVEYRRGYRRGKSVCTAFAR
ncbi:hypothetical protein CXG81DRAFT_18320 [Caulochytrium protostelioides]|uniref:Uncharacterized protein n=1 Tax=Caulochytrium protostelioides TaxID=1555241 RepID=A0A4P9X9J1_9FUNG|nr:hypothetical protein CXG81DRAFT_18320 [Caulochytrium protostelioides]|eukprot:RKP01962.1 hypothetical protein CXG81DRAFT_18320 [Caulochytrium protostelioides]